MNRSEVAEHLGIKPGSLSTMLADGRMVRPDVGSGKGALWKPETIEVWRASRPGRGTKPTDPLARFMAKVKVDEAGCWIWQGYIAENGYGTFRTSKDKRGPAHRRGYELLVGPVPKHLELDHLCRVRACVNPGHLEPVTPAVNRNRAPSCIEVVNKAKTHCPKGHEYDEQNTYVRSGKRHCRECMRAYNRRRYWERKEAQGLPAQPQEPAA